MSGVVNVSTSESKLLIRPISVFPPVATTMPFPCPDATNVPEKAIQLRSPSAACSSTERVSFSTATDSPVRIDSCIDKPWASNKRKSAGTLSPASIKTISPGTSSSPSILTRSAPRITWATGASICWIAPIADSALPS